jgi:Ca2+-binding RTX toxin-like protein
VNLDGQDEDDTIVLNLRNIPTGVNIVAEGGGGDDLITANLTGAPVAPDVRARGGAGNDKFAVKDVLGNSADISVANESSGARLTVDPATIECVQYYGFDGNDQMTHLATTRSFMDGGAGDDTLTGGAMRDLLFGGDGVDSLLGNAGDDFLFADINGQGVETVRDGDFVNGGPGLDTVATRGIDNIDGFTTDESEFTQQEGANFDVVFWLTADFKATTFNAAKTAELLADALSKDCAQKLDFTPAP